MALEADLLAGETIGKFKVETLIGEGGMAYVYRGKHIDLDQRVAIKVLFPEFLRRKAIRARFKREARLQFKLQHPNIVRVIDFIDEEKVLGMVLDWVNGGDLNGYLKKRKGPRSLSEIRRLFLPILDGMSHAHEKGIIHRDLKPHNIMLHGSSGNEIPKIMDFGIAWSLEDDGFQTKTGAVIGTPLYLSPEQATASKQIDHRTDVYALGITLFQMLTGRLPFWGESAVEVVTAHCFQTPPSIKRLLPDLPPAIDDVVQKALAKEPENRFANCMEFYEALDAVLPHEYPASVAKIGVFRDQKKGPNTLESDTLQVANEKGSKTSFEVDLGIPKESLSEKPQEPTPDLEQTGHVSLLDVGEERSSDPIFDSSSPLPSGDSFEGVPMSVVASPAPLEVTRIRRKKGFPPWLFVGMAVLFLLASFILLLARKKTAQDNTNRLEIAMHQKKKENGQRSFSTKRTVVPAAQRVIPPKKIVKVTIAANITKRKVSTKQRVFRRRLKKRRVLLRQRKRKKTRRKRKISARSCQACVHRFFFARQSDDIAGHNPVGMAGEVCNFLDFIRAGKRCRSSCGKRFYHYCKAYSREKIGRCRRNLLRKSLLRDLRKYYADAQRSTALRCLK